MEIFPAIDILDGKVVRLSRGDYDRVTVYGENPMQTAREFKKSGARNLHVVDLDGARDGRPSNFDAIRQIASDVGMFVEVGGGIRDENRVASYLEAGAGRVILGTAAVNDFGFLREMVKRHGDRIAVSVDAVDDLIAINGWKEATELRGMDFCLGLKEIGVGTVIYTDISRDGGLSGANLAAYERLAEIKGLNVIASGGISFESELEWLREKGVYGAILGKALYSGKLSLERAMEIGGRDGAQI